MPKRKAESTAASLESRNGFFSQKPFLKIAVLMYLVVLGPKCVVANDEKETQKKLSNMIYERLGLRYSGELLQKYNSYLRRDLFSQMSNEALRLLLGNVRKPLFSTFYNWYLAPETEKLVNPKTLQDACYQNIFFQYLKDKCTTGDMSNKLARVDAPECPQELSEILTRLCPS